MRKHKKSLAFLYTSNKKSEREIKETILFTIATKKNLVINPSKQEYIMEKIQSLQ